MAKKTLRLDKGVHFEGRIMDEYMNEFGHKLYSGDHHGKCINEKKERRHIDSLKNLYDHATSKSPKNVMISENGMSRIGKDFSDYFSKKEIETLKKKGKGEGLKGFYTFDRGKGILASLGVAAASLSSLGFLEKARGDLPVNTPHSVFKAVLPLYAIPFGAGAAIGIHSIFSRGNKPHIIMNVGSARKRKKLTDEQLRDILRGGVIEEVEEKDRGLSI